MAENLVNGRVAVSAPYSPTGNLPTAEDLRLWRKERERLLREEKAIRRSRLKLEKAIEAVAAFVGTMPNEQSRPTRQNADQAPAAAQRKERKRGDSWTITIAKILKEANRGMTHAELKAEVAKTHHGETLQRTEKSFYGAIGKLAGKKEVIKHKGWLFTAENFEKFRREVESGLKADIPAPSSHGGHHSPNKVAIIRFLSEQRTGKTAGQIIENLLKNPETKDAVAKNATPIYNLLARMKKRGELKKRGDRFYLALEVEAPGSEEPSASNHHVDGNGTPSSSGNGSLATSFALPDASPAQSGE